MTLGLKSLTQVKNGHILIAHNPDLCYAEGMRWDSMIEHGSQEVLIIGNADPQSCCKSQDTISCDLVDHVTLVVVDFAYLCLTVCYWCESEFPYSQILIIVALYDRFWRY